MPKPALIVIEGNDQATHYANLYREAHWQADLWLKRYQRVTEGVEAILSTIKDKENPTRVLLEAVIAASRWDGENA